MLFEHTIFLDVLGYRIEILQVGRANYYGGQWCLGCILYNIILGIIFFKLCKSRVI